jgi:hypothetical protein
MSGRIMATVSSQTGSTGTRQPAESRSRAPSRPASDAGSSRNGGKDTSLPGSAMYRGEVPFIHGRHGEDGRCGVHRIDGGPVAEVPGAVRLLAGDRCLGHDIGDGESAAYHGPEPIGRLVVGVIGEP